MQPQFQYQITDNMAARLGYRRVGYRFKDDNDNELNIDMSGLIVGLGVTF
jgi:opacity protein-like surface antigen